MDHSNNDGETIRTGCSCAFNGCENTGEYEVTFQQMAVCGVHCTTKNRKVCAEHAIQIVSAHSHDAVHAASSLARNAIKKRSFIRNVTKVFAEYESQQKAPQEVRSQEEKKEVPIPQDDELTLIFQTARCYIAKNTFTYSFLVTLLRAVLILNGIFLFGGEIWRGSFEAQEVFRFFVVLSTVLSSRVLDMLRGGSISKGTPLIAEGIFDLSLVTLPLVPTPRQVRKYSWGSIERSLLPDCLGVGSAMEIFRSINEETRAYGVTVDAVHGKRRTSVVSDASGTPMLVGTGTGVDLTGARVYFDELGVPGLEDGALNLDLLANMLLTVQLHDFMTNFSVCLAVIPLVSETGPTIANIILHVRQLVFSQGGWLIYAGGDWASANRTAFTIVKSQSLGNESTRLDAVENAVSLPFYYGTDLLEHSLKHLKLQMSIGMFIQGRETHVDQVLYDLRGVLAHASGHTLVLTRPGDFSMSSYNGRSLVDIFNGSIIEAKEFHRELARAMTKDVICQTDPMASRPAFLLCKLGKLLRRVGATREAWYCDMMDKLYGFAKGENSTGGELSANQNLQQGMEFLSMLREWKDGCSGLCQDARGGARLRGFITTELHESIVETVGSFRSLCQLSEANGGVLMLRNTIMMSFVNETTHSYLRSLSAQVHIDVCARALGKLMNMLLILADPARTFRTVVGQGGKQSYQGAAEHDHAVRNAAIEKVRETGKWGYELKPATKPKLAAEEKADRKIKECQLKIISTATNTKIVHFTVSFRQSLGASHFDKFNRNESRRSFLSQSMENPGKLISETSKHKARTFEVKEAVLVKKGVASVLVCELGGSTGWVVPLPVRMMIELRVRDATGKQLSYTLGLGSLVSVVMELRYGARVSDRHGIVVVTFFFVVCGEVQVLSITPLKSDHGVCTMLANLTPLQGPLLGAASTDDDTMSLEMELVGSWARKWVQALGAGGALSAHDCHGMTSLKSICSNCAIETYPRGSA